ncbi:MAG TPA: bifunctional 3-(3-hydroxy-phenyl)propionate/3-hydroxycinnamic acid hydroxylase, partial [Acidimicrobiia bacterium]|nr:bifunctional 3-(3-hydroxy-phenyl)propionate/3-hydroxycinnamic acid hydroxylase [Acidimicrobiia bacterium]
AIVGLGPVGAVLANLLGRSGRSTVVLEAATDVYHLPRAAHFDGEIMRVFQHLGLADELVAAVTPVLGMDFVDAAGERIFGFDRADRDLRDGWDAGYLFYQPELERVLRRGVERYPEVEVRLGTEVCDLRLSESGVELDTVALASGARRTYAAKWLVGCDGARSIVRKHRGIALDDSGFDQPWLVVDTMLRPDATCALPDRVHQICDPARPATFVPSVGEHRRWEVMLLDDDTADAVLQPERIAELLSPWVTVGRDVDVIRAAVYSFHALLATRWRDGRVLLAGDAAHQMPPFLGQGMCAGIRDARNLAWKLDLVLDGVASDALLDTYQQEREPHVRAITDLAVTLGGIIQTTDPDVAAARDEAIRGGAGPVEQQGMPAIGAGLVVRPGVSGTHVGRTLPQGRPGADDRLGDGFALVGPRAAALDVSAFPFPLARVVEAGAATALVRPDRIVAAVVDDQPAFDAFVDVVSEYARLRG